MCGIVGYVGHRDAASIILDGLQRLEYRGYDSAGIALLNDGEIQIRRDVGKLSNLRQRVDRNPVHGCQGIGHTRWATHGVASRTQRPSRISATFGDYVVVHNGIVENYLDLREELCQDGVNFRSDTDTEVIAHLIEHYAQNGAAHDLGESTRRAALRLRGSQAIVVLSKKSPGKLVAVRIGNAGGVAIGLGEHENFIASDIPAILEYTRRIIFLENRQLATITDDSYSVQTLDSQPVYVEPQNVPWDPVSAAKGEYKHFMHKEIFDQARSIDRYHCRAGEF